jgi:perosamine synthetase
MIPQMEPWFGEEEAEAVAAYVRAGGWLTEFQKTRAFEQAIAAYTGARHCIVTNNGTISLTLAALALGVGAGDEVIVPNYTMIATPNSVLMIGAKPVFVDVEPETLCVDVAAARAAITPRTKALMLVAANGRYPKAGIGAFERLCAERGLALIEDSAQALGSLYPDGRHIGRAGRIGSFSFSMPKVISTGQGGALITDDDALAARLRELKDFGRASGGNDIHDTIGWNFKFTDLQAVVGLEQMKKLAWRVARKKAIWQAYADGLEGVAGIRLFAHDLERTSPWFIDAMCERRDALAAHLKERGVGSRAMYPPINRQKAYNAPGDFPVSDRVGREGLWLPSAAQLADDQIADICAAIRAFYG